MAKRKTTNNVEYVRPYQTHYFDQHDAKEGDHVAWGACSTEESAVVHAVGHVFGKRHAKALIYDRRSGIILYTIRNDAMGIRILFGRDVRERELMERQERKLTLVKKAA